MKSVLHPRRHQPFRAFSERVVALLLGFLVVLGMVSAPLCMRAETMQMHVMVMPHSRVSGMDATMRRSTGALCDDPCCQHSRPNPVAPGQRACMQHCIAAEPATMQVLAPQLRGVHIAPPALAAVEPLVASQADISIEARRQPAVPLIFAVPLRI